jgi:hypothetical protein
MAVGLTLGSLDLIDPTGTPYAIETLSEGTDWGNPQPIEVAVRSLLQDGSIAVTEGHDNREVRIRVVITSDDMSDLADGDAALFKELGKPNILTYTPPGTGGVDTVFDVVTSSLEQIPDDLAEVDGEHHWSVRLVCLPFGRSASQVSIAALPATGSTTTSVDAGSATTNWTATFDGGSVSPGVVSGAVGYASSSVTGTRTIALTRTASITTSSTKYLVVDWSSTPSQKAVVFTAWTGSTQHEKVSEYVLASGKIRSVFYVVASSVSSVTFKFESQVFVVAAVRSLYIDNIDRSDVRPIISTGRQSVRSVAVSGSARTQATIAVEHATDALGDCLVYAFKDTGVGYLPALRQFRTAGSSTSDSSLVSGARDMLDTTLTYSIPAKNVPPGPYILLARLKGTGSHTAALNVEIRPLVNGTVLSGPVHEVTASVVVPTSTYSIEVLGPKFMLPMVDLPDNTTATIQIEITDSDTSGFDVDLDEAWLFNLELGTLTWFNCGTTTAASGGSSNRLWMIPPTLDYPRPRILRGFASDKADAFHPVVFAWGEPEFTPPGSTLFVVTTNAVNPSVTASYFPRWHSHAGS